jgi:hypothetical protein
MATMPHLPNDKAPICDECGLPFDNSAENLAQQVFEIQLLLLLLLLIETKS